MSTCTGLRRDLLPPCPAKSRRPVITRRAKSNEMSRRLDRLNPTAPGLRLPGAVNKVRRPAVLAAAVRCQPQYPRGMFVSKDMDILSSGQVEKRRRLPASREERGYLGMTVCSLIRTEAAGLWKLGSRRIAQWGRRLTNQQTCCPPSATTPRPKEN